MTPEERAREVIWEAAFDDLSLDACERLVAAAIRAALDEQRRVTDDERRLAVEEETERCASIAECWDLGTPEGHRIAAAIRRKP